MLIIIFLISLFGSIYKTHDVKETFWVVIGNPNQCFNLPFLRNIEWIPDIIGIDIKVSYIGSQLKSRIIETTINAKRSVITCSDDLKVPYSDIIGIDTVKIEIYAYWEKLITIDQTSWTLNLRDIRNDDHDLKMIFGERNKILFQLKLSAEIGDFPKYSIVKFLWSEVINEIKIDEPICMRVWDRPGTYNLFPNVILEYLPRLYKYSYMVVTAYSDQNMQQIVNQETHLVYIYQCKHLNNIPLKIAVVDSTNAVSLTLMERELCNSQRINLIKENGLFVKKYNHLDLDSLLDVVVTTQNFKTNWKYRKNIYFLHDKKTKTKRCANKNGPDIKDVKIEMVKSEGVKYVLNSVALAFHPNFKIFYWRMATLEEENWCKNFKSA